MLTASPVARRTPVEGEIPTVAAADKITSTEGSPSRTTAATASSSSRSGTPRSVRSSQSRRIELIGTGEELLCPCRAYGLVSPPLRCRGRGCFSGLAEVHVVGVTALHQRGTCGWDRPPALACGDIVDQGRCSRPR